MSDTDENGIERRTVYLVTHDGRREEFTSPAEAVARVHGLAAELRIDEAAEFGGGLNWFEDEVPASYLDKLLDEYVYNLHNDGGADAVNREQRYLLVEENRHGGYWLRTVDSVERAVSYHEEQEYLEDWSIVAVYDVVEEHEVRFEVERTTKVKVLAD